MRRFLPAILALALLPAAVPSAHALTGADQAREVLFGGLLPERDGWTCVLQPHDIRKKGRVTHERTLEIVPEVDDAAEEVLREQARLLIAVSGDAGASYLTPEQRARIVGNPRIGVHVTKVNGMLYVHAVEFGSPAHAAGILPGDQIVSVGGKGVFLLPDADAEGLVFPDAASRLEVVIRRHGTQRALRLTPTRMIPPEISLRRVSGMLVVRIAYFGDKTQTALRSLLLKRLPGNAGLILDLRGNAGGGIEASRALHSLFFPKGDPFVRVLLTDDRRCEAGTRDKQLLHASYPVAVLTDAGTANGAELLAATLQERKRATIIGERTWGLARLEKIFDGPDGTTLRLSVGELRTADGRAFKGAGVKSDERVALGPPSDDRQLRRAVEVLQWEIDHPPVTEDAPTPHAAGE